MGEQTLSLGAEMLARANIDVVKLRRFCLKVMAVGLGFMAFALLLGMAGDMAFAQPQAEQQVQAPQAPPVAQVAPAQSAPGGGQPGALDRAVETISGDGR